MPEKLSVNKREILNQLINFFWTIIGFAPVLWFWIEEGINVYFYLFLAAAFFIMIVPVKILNGFMLSSSRNFYERLGVKRIRKFVQNGDTVKSLSGKQGQQIVSGVLQAQRYLKTIAMYERFHWACFIFFLLTAILCFARGYILPGLMLIIANIIYNLTTILLQQYNKIRIRKLLNA